MAGRARKLLSWLPENLKGAIDYYCLPNLAEGFGPLNGQALRQRIFRRLMDVGDVKRIVETGTYRGTTTEFFAGFNVPVLTVETNHRYYTYSKLRLRKMPQVTVVRNESVQFLRNELPHERYGDGTTLFYLDAHWYAGLPVREEIGIICNNVDCSIIMIDDFEVPNDPGYGYDDYGDGNKLSIDYLDPAPGDRDLLIFFPSDPSSEETGARRGTCVITSNPELGERLKTISELGFFGVIARPRE